MIILRSEKGEIYNLFLKKKHVVGRNGNLELEGDKSVSRQHAVIYFSIKDKKPHILLEDLGSKYGTYINDGIQTSKEISKNTPITLKVGDSIRFGQQWNTWTVQESQIVVTTSMLSEQEKRKLRSILAPMKGVLVSDWSESCTHLTMNGVKITIKVVCALGSVKPIVSMEYWQVLSEVWNSSVEEDMPDCDDYVPPLTEPTLSNVPINLKMSYARKRLFRDVKFVACTSSQYNSILPMVTNAGGTVLDGTRTAITEQEFLDEKILVLDATNINKRNQNLAQLLKLLTKHKQRRIPESEIGLSLIFCSMDKYCNPHSQEEFISRQPESQVTIKDEDLILAQETQDLGEENSTQFFDSESSKISLTVNENRIFSDSDEDDVVLETQPSRMLLASPKPATKRKLDHKTDKPNVKTSKLDSWLITKKPVATSTMISEPSAQPHSSSESTKTKTKSLFAFPSEKKTTERSSNSLFKNVNVASTSDRSDVGENTRKRTSIELFSSYESPSVPVKKTIVEKKSLFQLPSTSNESKPKRSLILFDSDSMDSFSDKTANLNIAPQPKVAEDSPVVVPRNISLSQFVEPQANKSNGEVKQEPCDMSTEVKEVFDKTIIHTLSLIKSNSKTITQTPNGGNTSTVVNFKKFRKNGIHHKTHVIKTNDLVLFKGKASADPDVHMNGDSDSS